MVTQKRTSRRSPRKEDIRALVRASIFMAGLFGSLVAYSFAG